MGTSNRDEIDGLVQKGLDHYGNGELERAISCWQEALARDPGHAEAREYLQTALEDAPDTEGASDAGAPAPDRNVLQEAQTLLSSDPEGALELLERAAAADPEHLELQGYVEMVRSRLLKEYRERLQVDRGLPALCLPPQQVMRYNLPPDAGFLLSLVDGTTTVKDLISVCGMDEFRSLRILTHLVDAGIVEIRT